MEPPPSGFWLPYNHKGPSALDCLRHPYESHFSGENEFLQCQGVDQSVLPNGGATRVTLR